MGAGGELVLGFARCAVSGFSPAEASGVDSLDDFEEVGAVDDARAGVSEAETDEEEAQLAPSLL